MSAEGRRGFSKWRWKVRGGKSYLEVSKEGGAKYVEFGDAGEEGV